MRLLLIGCALLLATGCAPADRPHAELTFEPAGGASRVEGAAPGERGAGMGDPRPGGVPEGVKAVLAEIKARDEGQLAVSEEDGRFLRALVAASGTQRALEIGGASGYSAIWIGLGLRETGGTLVTIEYDPVRARELEAHVGRAGLGGVVRVVTGDAFARIPELEGTFDFVFLDAWKRDYARFFALTYPRLEPGGLFLGHNVVNKRDELVDFLEAIESHPMLFTTIVAPSGEGLSISYRRKGL
jgi:caffeoyl-CoA O-methyltransferase